MKFDLSIIITHFNPFNFNKKNPLVKTLQKIGEQKSNYNIEIIIADDGSYYTREILTQNSENYKLKNDERSIYLSKNKELNFLFKQIGFESKLVSQWVYLPKLKQCMSKARVLNHAVKISNSENLFFLDDDNYFISNNSPAVISIHGKNDQVVPYDQALELHSALDEKKINNFLLTVDYDSHGYLEYKTQNKVESIIFEFLLKLMKY